MGSYGAQELTDQRDFRASLCSPECWYWGRKLSFSLGKYLLLLSENALRSVLCILKTCSSSNGDLGQWVTNFPWSAICWPQLLQGRNRVKLCFPEARERLWENSTVSQLIISFQSYAADVICLSLIASISLQFSFFNPSFTWVFYSLGLLYRKTLIECLLMLWPLCLHPAFSAALTPSTHCKVCKTSVRLPRKASHYHFCNTPQTYESNRMNDLFFFILAAPFNLQES